MQNKGKKKLIFSKINCTLLVTAEKAVAPVMSTINSAHIIHPEKYLITEGLYKVI